jgi:hypothetical protein
MTVFLHHDLTSISIGGHEHKITDTVKVRRLPDNADLSLDPVEPVDVEEPALESDQDRVWRISCAPACEAAILATVQHSGVQPKSVPLTVDERLAVEHEQQMGQLEMGQALRALAASHREQVTAGSAK